MQNLSICRICLATDVRLCSVARSLQDMYEKLTELTFKREDRRPLTACYICHARLQNCYRLRTSCLRSDKLLTEMMSSGEFQPQDVLSTNTFRVVSALHLSLGHALDSTECHVKDQLYTEDIVTEPQEEKCAQIDDNNQYPHLEDPLDIIKEEADDIETDAEYINLEEVNVNIEEIDWKPDVAGPSSQSADNIYPKIVKVVSERIDLNESRVGVRVSKKSKVAALKNAEDSTINNRIIEVERNEETETITIKEHKIVSKKTEIAKPITSSKILETCNKVDIKLNNCDEDTVVTSIVNEVCEEKSTKSSSLQHNVSSISSRERKPFSCYVCNKCFKRKDSLKKHIRTHAGEKPYQCNVCNKCYSRKDNLRSHTLIHTGEKPYQCNVCKKCYKQKGDLQKHIRTHTGEKPYQCNVCNKCFSRKDSLKTHMHTHTGEKPYQCNVCKKCYKQKGDLQNHIRTHTGEKPYQCNVCNKCFSRKDLLKKHIRIHTGEKPNHCNVCKKCFTEKGDLQNHIRTHTGEKPYQCNVCNKCFIQKGDLQKHIRTHTGEKPYQCNVCNKCFSRKDLLNKHIIRKHTGKKPYKCNVCKKCFVQKGDLQKQIRTNTGEKPYQCNVCNKCNIIEKKI